METGIAISQIVELLAKPLQLEIKDGCRDRSITGKDLGSYALSWIEKGLSTQDQATKRRLGKLAQILGDYRSASSDSRRRKVKKALCILAEIEGTPVPEKEKSAGSKKSVPQPARTLADPSDLSQLVEVPQKRKKHWTRLLPKLGIATKHDLLYHFPRDYVPCKRIGDLRDGERAFVVVEAGARRVEAVRATGSYQIKRYALEVKDDSGEATVYSFVKCKRGGRAIRAAYSPLALDHKPRTRLLLEATVKRWGNRLELQYLDSQVLKKGPEPVPPPGRQVPIYPLTDGMYQNQIRPVIREIVDNYASVVPEILPADLLRERHLLPTGESLRNIHWPEDEKLRQRARRRLVFEEFFSLQLALAARKREIQKEGKGLRLPAKRDIISALEKVLPFRLTDSQKQVIREIARDMTSNRSMNRLLQGDVGSGKTVVALAALLIALENGFQGALMVPTEILAEQHYLVLSKLLPAFGMQLDLLIGTMKQREKREASQRIREGKTDVVVGTHALIQEGVEFHRLGMVVVDEQHRFGVMQRATLREKGLNPELLVMTATPIPRTLALTVYGDLDISVIDEMPPGRKPVETSWYSFRRQNEAYDFVRQQVAEGRQAYLVCPLIAESEKLEVEAATKLAEQLQKDVFPELRVGLLHGRMKTAEKDETMEAFRHGEVDILTSTTVIEVGVDVPNASVILVLNAERFGLAQLHQLRGRVGRSHHQAYCILLTDDRYDPEAPLLTLDDEGKQARHRMRVMTEETDGFAIAEQDLLLRGPGEFYGTRQHGLPDLKLARVIEDVHILQEAREAAFALIERDPNLSQPQHRLLRERLDELKEKVELAVE